MIFIGLDVGSTAVKAVAVDENGSIISRGRNAYNTLFTSDGGVLQNPADWWEASVRAVRETVAGLKNPRDVRGFGLSSQGGSIFAATRNGEPLCDAMTWMDRRAVAEAAKLSARFGDRIYYSCGWPSSPSDCAAKLMRLRRENPEAVRMASLYLTTQDYITLRLCGVAVTDPTAAAITRLYDINEGQYNQKLLDFIGVGKNSLPRVFSGSTPIGTLTKETAELFGLDPSVVVYNGMHDQYCASLGAGVAKKGELLIATGTAWALFGVADRPVFCERRISPGIHPEKGLYGAMASLSGIGAELEKTARDAGETPASLDTGAAGRLESASDVYFCPCPPDAGFIKHRAVGAAGTPARDIYDAARATMEGAAFEVRLAADIFGEEGLSSDAGITMSGGAAKSALWTSITAAVLGRDISVAYEADAPALGAAMSAAVGAGIFESCRDAAGVFVKGRHVSADPALSEFYRVKFENYKKYYI